MISSADRQELATMCQAVGRDVRLVQGGGGNASVKSVDGTRFIVKASGWRMADVTPERGFVELGVEEVLGVMDDPALGELAPTIAAEAAFTRIRELGVGEGRPSMEASFHALGARAVLHTHAVYANAFACMEGGEKWLRDRAPHPSVWVPYVLPGHSLALAIRRAIAEEITTADTPWIVLENHGLIVSGESAQEAIEQVQAFTRFGASVFGAIDDFSDSANPSPDLLRIVGDLRSLHPGLEVRPSRYAWVQEGPVGRPLIPDDAVYAGERPLDPDETEGLAKFVVWIPGQGAILGGPSRMLDAMDESLLAHVLVRRLIARAGGTVRELPKYAVTDLIGLESERHRQAVAAQKTR